MKSHLNYACEEFQKHFDPIELSSSKLSVTERELILNHTSTCLGCARWLKDWELITSTTSKLAQHEVPNFVLRNVMDAIQPAAKASVKEQTVKADIMWVAGGFGTLMLAFTFLGADSIDGVASWSLSFVVAIVINQLFKSGKLREATH